jgi:predicted  nucleic acid-binding Zn-ribbon protein
MLPELERLIRLQQLETATADTRRDVDALPSKLTALDDRLKTRTDALADAERQVVDHRSARAHLEKDLASVQGRLSKYKDQLMEVKTNKEYAAMQKEITVAQEEVSRLEDRILERLLESDELTARVKQTQQELAAERAAIDQERAALDRERQGLSERLATLVGERARVAREIDRQTLQLFDIVASKRSGIAVVEARSGLCTSCHVRLRPQVFNDLRLNNALIQCESCQRILFYDPANAVPLPSST